MLNRLEKIKVYRKMQELIVKEDSYNKQKGNISLMELLKMSNKRFLLMQDILNPLREALTKDLGDVSISFGNRDQKINNNPDELYIMVQYGDDGRYIVFTQYDDIEMPFCISNDISIDCHRMEKNNQKLITDALNQGFSSHFEQSYKMINTSKRFIIMVNNDYLRLCDKADGQYINVLYQFGMKDCDSQIARKLYCCYPKIKEYLEFEVNLESFMQNMKIYEEQVPRCLKKFRY